MTIPFGRVLRTGLSSLRDRAAARLAALRFNPSRIDPEHEFEPFCWPTTVVDQYGNEVSRSVRRGRICGRCGATEAIGFVKCKPGQFFSVPSEADIERARQRMLNR